MANWTTIEGNLSDSLPMRVYLAEQDGEVCAVTVHDDRHPRSEDEFLWKLRRVYGPKRCETGSCSEALQAAALQVSEYFAGRRLAFDVPLALDGTPFQVRVWELLMQIPFGETRRYKDIAELMGHPTAFRAVGNANGQNRLPILVPCHRVLAAGGKLGGFTGGIGLKRRLLAHEAAVLGSRHPEAAFASVAIAG